ncbi:hypothetical protein K469DRAFT_731902 [Zopfia rhizophila CBS 207.26]|uniref:Uncharacterized protein n=1 Tax=Zopfia rhizophila CBS 207.26 TaxID=1314779 RepID=A0A6A6DF95_9PEZI|nr:hypothetical protein K469DRAFT_731902 [Zopfia rhizophila CBS 207.26]
MGNESLVLKHEYDCRPMALSRKATRKRRDEGSASLADYLSTVMTAENGCEYGLEVWESFDSLPTSGGAMWKQCEGNEIILATSNWADRNGSVSTPTFAPDFRIRSELCTPSYWMAELPITAAISETSSTIGFDENRFLEGRQPIPENVLDISHINDITLDANWSTYMFAPSDQVFCGPRAPTFGGLSSIHASTYNFNSTALVHDADVPERAALIRQRIFGELMHSAFNDAKAFEREKVSGFVSVAERRIVVIAEVVVLLASFFIISSVFLGLVFWLSRLGPRPLNLRSDPSTTSNLISLVASQPEVLRPLMHFDQSTKSQLQAGLTKNRYFSAPGVIYKMEPALNDAHVASGIAVLYDFAQPSFTVSVLRVSTLAPYSIIPTFLAPMRILQPYLAMSQEPTHLKKGAGLSYQSSYWAYAAFKAAKNRHWFLFLVTLGSTLCQILIISMSALIERESGTFQNPTTVTRDLKLRQLPILMALNGPIGTKDLANEAMANVYTNSTTNRMYAAAIQLTLNGSEPPWSQSGWSFVLIDTDDDERNLDELFSALNVSFTTSAIRARLDCIPIPNLSNNSAWLGAAYNTADLSNASLWKVSVNPEDLKEGYTLGDSMFSNTTYNTSLLAHPYPINCCANGTKAGTGDVAVGYWSSNNPLSYPHSHEQWHVNFTTKWIHGPARMVYYLNDSEAYVWAQNNPPLFSQIPKIQALNCQPVIETADAHVAVDQRSGQILSYAIPEPVKVATEAWTDSFIPHNDGINKSIAGDPRTVYNVTTSYGVLFVDALLGAADLDIITPYTGRSENLGDRTFNIRDEKWGLNLHFMTYSMFELANKDPTALLSETRTFKLANHTFATFSAFVSQWIDLKDGGLGYQRIEDSSFDGMAAPVSRNFTNDPTRSYPVLNTNRTVIATVTTRIEVLRMNAVAVWLSFGILVWLSLTTITFMALQRATLRGMKGVEGLQKDRSLLSKLGWFSGSDGRVRWGIEVVDTVNGGAVEWVDVHYMKKEKKTSGS